MSVSLQYEPRTHGRVVCIWDEAEICFEDPALKAEIQSSTFVSQAMFG